MTTRKMLCLEIQGQERLVVVFNSVLCVLVGVWKQRIQCYGKKREEVIDGCQINSLL
jgi:hypothetical protein